MVTPVAAMPRKKTALRLESETRVPFHIDPDTTSGLAYEVS
jgi:hypothetical protein